MKKEKAPPREDLMKVIIAVKEETVIRFVKYHRIPVKQEKSFEIFKRFVKRKFPNAQHLNCYGGITGDFYKQFKLN